MGLLRSIGALRSLCGALALSIACAVLPAHALNGSDCPPPGSRDTARDLFDGVQEAAAAAGPGLDYGSIALAFVEGAVTAVAVGAAITYFAVSTPTLLAVGLPLIAYQGYAFYRDYDQMGAQDIAELVAGMVGGSVGGGALASGRLRIPTRGATRGAAASAEAAAAAAGEAELAAGRLPARGFRRAVSDPDRVMREFMNDWDLTEESILYRWVDPQYLDAGAGLIEGNRRSVALVGDLYNLGRSPYLAAYPEGSPLPRLDMRDILTPIHRNASELGPSLNVSVARGSGYDGEGRVLVGIRLGDVLDVGGRLYPDIGAAGAGALIVTVPKPVPYQLLQ